MNTPSETITADTVIIPDRRDFLLWRYARDESPPLHVPVLVFIHDADWPVWIAAKYASGWYYIDESDPITSEVLAWTALPAAPTLRNDEPRKVLTDAEIVTFLASTNT